LDNAGETVELQQPIGINLDTSLFGVIDRVSYRDEPPWPMGADGFGLSLQRFPTDAFADDPAHWRATFPTPGRLSSITSNLPVLLKSPRDQRALGGSTVVLEVNAEGSAPLSYQWQFNIDPDQCSSGARRNLCRSSSESFRISGQ